MAALTIGGGLWGLLLAFCIGWRRPAAPLEAALAAVFRAEAEFVRDLARGGPPRQRRGAVREAIEKARLMLVSAHHQWFGARVPNATLQSAAERCGRRPAGPARGSRGPGRGTAGRGGGSERVGGSPGRHRRGAGRWRPDRRRCRAGAGGRRRPHRRAAFRARLDRGRRTARGRAVGPGLRLAPGRRRTGFSQVFGCANCATTSPAIPCPCATPRASPSPARP